MKTKVVNIHSEEYDILIDRSTKWGNPYSHRKGTAAEFVVANRTESIQKYREYLAKNEDLLADLHELDGKVLGCHCKPKSCHGDVLVEFIEKSKKKSLFDA